MPFIRTTTNSEITETTESNLKSKFGEAIKLLGKTENWLMLEFNDKRKMYFKGSKEEGIVFIEVKCLGNISNTSEMTKELTNIIVEELNIPSNQVYITYQGFSDPGTWGYNGSNF